MEKILVFNGYYLPAKNYGGPLTSLQNVIETCSDEFEFYVISRNHDYGSSVPFELKTNIWHKLGKANIMYIENGYLDYSIKNMHLLLSSLKPSMIWFSGVLVPKVKIVGCVVAKRLGIPILISPRGEVNEDHLKIKSIKKKAYLGLISLIGIFKGCFFHSTCVDETKGINNYFNPTDNRLFCVTNVAVIKQSQIIQYEKVKGVLRAIFHARIHPIKGVDFVIKCLAQCKSMVVYDIYGPIEDKDYWVHCKGLAQQLPDNIIVNYCGYLDSENKASTIQSHDCLLFATSNENYSHTIAESLANSRPVIISKGTTPWDDLDGKAGFVIPLDSPAAWAERIDYLASLDQKEFNEWIHGTSNYYDTSSIIQSAVSGHKSMFNSIIESQNDN